MSQRQGARSGANGDADPGDLTLAAIAPVRDPTARGTLEQAEALVTGLRRAARLGSTPAALTAADAEALAREALGLIACMADRDAKADVFHAAVRDAGQREQALRSRVHELVARLRAALGPTAPELADLGVAPDAHLDADLAPARAKPGRPPGPLWSSSITTTATTTAGHDGTARDEARAAHPEGTPPRSAG
jgi:hypothetical protein